MFAASAELESALAGRMHFSTTDMEPVAVDDVSQEVCMPLPPFAIRAGPRDKIFFDPATVTAAIITTGKTTKTTRGFAALQPRSADAQCCRMMPIELDHQQSCRVDFSNCTSNRWMLFVGWAAAHTASVASSGLFVDQC
jgi:hypothetical protein